jgi:hypothetical protein
MMKSKVFWVALLLTIISWSNLFAQGTPCGDSGDPDVPSECPLDTWVGVLVIVFLVYITIRLRSKQQMA